MQLPDRDSPGITIVCERKSLARVLLSPVGIAMVLVAPCSFGLSLVLLFAMYLWFPRRVWVCDNRLFSDKSLPPNGVALHELRPTPIHLTLLGFTINRALSLSYRDEQGTERHLGINQFFASPGSIDQVLAALPRR